MKKVTASNNQATNFRRLVKIILPVLFGLVCFYYILTNFHWTEIWRILQTADIFKFLISSITTTIVFWFFRTLRWAFLLRSENYRISLPKLYLYTAITVGFANFTPFQSGEALKVELFRKYGGQRLSGYTFFILEKLLDLLVITALSLLGIFVIFEFNLSAHIQIILIGFIIILTIGAFLVFWLAQKWQRFERNKLPNLKTVIVSFLLTLASWLTMIAGWKIMLQSIAVDLTFLQTASVISLTTVIGILSLVPGAIGVTEISIATLLSQLGYADSTAQAGAIMMTLYSLIILLLAMIHLIILKLTGYKKATELKEATETEPVIER